MEAHAIADENPFAAADEQFAALKRRPQAPGTRKMEHSEVEELIEVEGREVLRLLMQSHLTLRSDHERREGRLDEIVGADGTARTHRRDTERGLETVFGRVQVARISYGARSHDSVQPMDAALTSPAELYSHGPNGWQGSRPCIRSSPTNARPQTSSATCMALR